MYVDNGGFDRHPQAITRDALRLPTVDISDVAEVDTPALLRPVFDAVWNASGHEQCFRYDEAGKFRGVR